MDKHEILKELMEIECPNGHEILKAREKHGAIVTYEGLVYVLGLTKYNLAKELGCSPVAVTGALRSLFPTRGPNCTAKVCNWLLAKYQLKQCKKCEEVLWFEDFNKNAGQANGINTYCKMCHCSTNGETQNARQSTYRCKKLQRTPKWSETEKIAEFYKHCPNGWAVDHIIPLQGELVSGLHVLNNLQYLTKEENSKKHNKFTID